MSDCVIFDVDGTLADNEHRQHFARQEQPDWLAFSARMKDDLLNSPVKELYDVLRNSGKYVCILVSGRSEDFRAVTEEWLEKNKISYDALFLRHSGDRRPDHKVKRDILMEIRKQGYRISFVVDDRAATVAMWRENGILCLQCADHNY